MNVTQEFVDACTGASFVDGRLENTDGNWWIGRVNGTVATVGWEASPISEAAANVLTQAGTVVVNGSVLLNFQTYSFKFDNEGVFDLA